MTYSYDVAVDWDYTGAGTPDFTTSGDDITAYVTGCSGQQGINKEIENIAAVGKCTIAVKNNTRLFSPKNSGGALYGKLKAGKPVRVRVTDGTTDTFFLGKIKSIKPSPGGQATATNGVISDRLAEIQCVDVMEDLRKSKISTPVMTQRYAQELIQVAINKALNAPAASDNLTFTAIPANNDTVTLSQTINGVAYGGTYTFKTSLGSAANEVLIGSSIEACMDNLCAAVNGAAGAGTLYTSATRPLIGFVTAQAKGYRYTVLQDNPVRYYRMGESVGPVADIGSNNAPAAVSGPTLGVAGALTNDPNTAVSFNGSSDTIALRTFDLVNRSFSIELWIIPGASPAANQDLWSVFGDFTANHLVYLRLESSGRLTLDFYLTGGNIQTATSLISFSGSAKYHVVVNFDSAELMSSIYVNNVLEASGALGPYTGGTQPTVQLGGFTAAGANYYKGVEDEVALYFKSLDPERIDAHYADRATAPHITFTAVLPGTVGNGIAASESSSAMSFASANFTGGVDYPTSPASSFESGDALIPFAGDDWQSDNTNGLTAIGDVVKSEGTALFWAQRSGALEFKNRGYVFRQGAVATSLTLSSQHQEADADISDEDVYNSVEVTIKPRRLKSLGIVGKINAPVQVPGRSGTERYDSNKKLALTADGSKVIKVQFTDPDTGVRCAAQNFVLPLVATTHYTLNEQSDGSGVDYTNGDPATGIVYVFFSVATNANNAEVSVVNKALGPLYVRTLQLQGEALVKYEPITAVAEDEDSQLAYGKRTLAVQLPLSGDQQFAEAYSRYLLGKYKEPEFRVKKITFKNINDVSGVKLHKLPFGSIVSYTDYQHAESAAKYMIRGVNWNFGSPVSRQMTQTFDVYKIDDFPYAVFDAGAPRGKFDQCVFGL